MPRLFRNTIVVGNSLVCCGGRCVLGPDRKNLFFSTLLILVPVIVYCTTVATILGVATIVLGAVFGAASFSAMYATALTDPGIVLKEDGSSGVNPPITVRDHGLQDGTVVRVKWCHTCKIFRPPRCSHCRVCNNCIEKFDHHCPYIGQCIGIRNYRYFLSFISLTSMLCMLVFVTSLVVIVRIIKKASEEGNSYWDTLGDQIAAIILVLISFIFLWFLGGLTLFHVYLQCKGRTTNENTKRPYGNENPYDEGCLGNFQEIWCASTPASHLASLLHGYPDIQESLPPESVISPQGIMMR